MTVQSTKNAFATAVGSACHCLPLLGGSPMNESHADQASPLEQAIPPIIPESDQQWSPSGSLTLF